MGLLTFAQNACRLTVQDSSDGEEDGGLLLGGGGVGKGEELLLEGVEEWC